MGVSSNVNSDNTEVIVLFDYESGQYLSEIGKDIKIHPSSMSKLMTLYTMFDCINNRAIPVDIDMMLTVPKKIWAPDESSMYLKEGQKVRLYNLLEAMASVSANDAAVTISSNVGKYLNCTIEDDSRKCFIQYMNRLAKNIGLSDSNFSNESGIPAEDHYMTPEDIIKLSIRMYEDFPEYYELFLLEEYSFNGIKQLSTNISLLKNKRAKNLGLDGIKTGHTSKGLYGISFSAKNDDRRLFGVVNYIKTDLERRDKVLSLLEYGFYSISNIKLFNAKETIKTVDLWDGSSVKTVKLFSKEDVVYSYKSSEIDSIDVSVRYNTKLEKENSKDSDRVIAKMYINSNGMKERIVDLYYLADDEIINGGILKNLWGKFIEAISLLISR